MRALALVLLAGCSTMSLRAGAVVTGGTPAFQATLEVGASVGTRRLYELTHENGVEVSRAGVARVMAANADVVSLDEERGPIASLGPRVRGTPATGLALGARGTFYTGLLRDPKTRSGGFGVELAGGVVIDGSAPVFEASIVLANTWSIL